MSFKYKVMGTVGLGNVVETILQNKSIENVNLFLNPTENSLEDEFLFDNISEAKDCLVKHISNNSKIVIIVDCDVDGYTAAAMIYQYIKGIKYNVQIDFIVHKGKEHGLDDDTMTKINSGSYNLVIVPDAGSNNYIQLEFLHKKQIDTIILDHHLAERYSDCAIVVNNQMSKNIKDKAMTGVGIVYKFCRVLDKHYNVNYAHNYLDLLALGMIADSCDLRNIQSRYLVLQGIEQIKNETNRNKFISGLIKSQSFSMNNSVTIIGIAFYIAPLINSLIRIGDYEDKCYMFEAFINADNKLIRKIRGKGEVELSVQDYVIKSCESAKRKQQTVVKNNVEELSMQIEEYSLNTNPIIVCNAGETVDKNFTGLIANKIASTYHKPCLLLRQKKDYCSGSGRGFDKSEINDFSKWCKDTGLFSFVEGHSNAFGCGISSDNMVELFNKLSTLEVSNELVYTVDAMFNDKTLNKTIIEMISKYSNVWGTSIDEPIFAIENIVVKKDDIKLMGTKQNTIKFSFHNIDFIKFNSNADIYNEIINIGENIEFTVIGRFSMNEFGGNKTPQVMISDMMYKASSIKQGFRF